MNLMIETNDQNELITVAMNTSGNKWTLYRSKTDEETNQKTWEVLTKLVEIDHNGASSYNTPLDYLVYMYSVDNEKHKNIWIPSLEPKLF